MPEEILLGPDPKPNPQVLDGVHRFLAALRPLESEKGIPLILLKDDKSKGFYVVCHLDAKTIVEKTDIDAVLDPMESEDYKLNRELYTDTYAYRKMKEDALLGRRFEDLVIEYDTTYRPHIPLKVFGGQHRTQAIGEAYEKGISGYHGVRVYFGLDRDQKLDIAIANNTAIAISNDLLDRMSEQHLGPELRQWAQSVGILKGDLDFADKRNSEGIPTIRVVRTLIVNYFLGKRSDRDDFHAPVVCSSGAAIDDDYRKVRKRIRWSDANLKRMGQEFSRLHHTQRERVLNREEDSFLEFANKATHLCVAAAWAYAYGYLESYFPDKLAHHLALSEIEDEDPLNATALSTARLKGVDPDTYRGIATRINRTELGRMLEVFLLQAIRARRRGITKKLANAAIKSFEAKKRTQEAEKAVKGL